MECWDTENGQSYGERGARVRIGLARQLGAGGPSRLHLDVATAVPRAAASESMLVDLVPRHCAPNDPLVLHAADPFMNNMDEISYWVYTKRAPCLFNYDNQIRKQNTEAQSSKPKTKSENEPLPTPEKKIKRKLSSLDDDSPLKKKQQNVYFDAPQQSRQAVPCSYNSDTLESDIDFNIKNSSIQNKPKKIKLQKSRTTVHKKNKVVTSTSKVTTALRRSLRRAQNGINNNGQCNESFEAVKASIANESNIKADLKLAQKLRTKLKKSPEKLAAGDNGAVIKNRTMATEQTNQKAEPKRNGQFDDLSDVSGFTANYIRSTKIHSTKTARNLRSKNSRNLIKEPGQNMQKEHTTMMICINKAVNTTDNPNATILNCSNDSSQNAINLITTKNNTKNKRINKSTSLLKFMDSKAPKCKETGKLDSSRDTSKTNLNISLLSRSSYTSRYPKRHKNHQSEDAEINSKCNRKRKVINNLGEFNDSDKKENPDEKSIRTRSGRSLGLSLRQPDNSVFVVSNGTEQISSELTVNVAVSQEQARVGQRKKKLQPSLNDLRCEQKSMDKSRQSSRRDSLRERSGFAACFSDSDNDSEPLKPRKFFC